MTHPKQKRKRKKKAKPADVTEWQDVELMVHDIREHVRQYGFHLVNWDYFDETKPEYRLGFRCHQTEKVWHIDPLIFVNYSPLLKQACKTIEGRQNLLLSFKLSVETEKGSALE